VATHVFDMISEDDVKDRSFVYRPILIITVNTTI
jgi:hypothetical protein